MREKQKGITLVALVVTIIVLLILAGVSLNLVAGSNGILNRTTSAVNVTNLANIKEELELKIAEMQLDYYSDSSLQSSYATVNEYVKTKFEEGIELSNGVDIICEDDGKLTYDGVEIGTLNPDGTITIDGEFNGGQIVAKYRVTYNTNGGTGNVPAVAKYDSGATVTVDFTTVPIRTGYNFLGWATSSSAKEPEYTNSGSFAIKGNTTLYAVWESWLAATTAIQPVNYGDTADYKANSVNDWQVFLNDGTYIYLIASDYVPTSGMTLGNGISKVDGNDYCVSGDTQANLLNWLTTGDWSKYAEGFSGAVAYGGPTKIQFTESYNAKYGTSYSVDDPFTIVDKASPYITHGYWLATSFPGKSDSLWHAYWDGYVGESRVFDPFDSCRPLVRLPAGVKAAQGSDGKWNFSM